MDISVAIVEYFFFILKTIVRWERRSNWRTWNFAHLLPQRRVIQGLRSQVEQRIRPGRRTWNVEAHTKQMTKWRRQIKFYKKERRQNLCSAGRAWGFRTRWRHTHTHTHTDHSHDVTVTLVPWRAQFIMAPKKTQIKKRAGKKKKEPTFSSSTFRPLVPTTKFVRPRHTNASRCFTDTIYKSQVESRERERETGHGSCGHSLWL
jgi:hypothetical protein